MPYNSYYPYNYQYPYSYYQPNYQSYQPMMQNPQSVSPMQQTQQVPAVQPLQTQQSSIIWVSGEKEAAMYPIAPNNAVTLWSQSEPVVYLKQADPSGKPTMKIYDLVERVESSSNASSPEDDKLASYATKEELSSIVATMKSMGEILGTIKGDIDTMRGDLYGIAGKKKTVTRKQEATEDDE